MGQVRPLDGTMHAPGMLDADPPVGSDDDAQFREFFENGAVALHLVGADGTILHANRAELELLGYERAEYVGRHIEEFHADEHVIADILARLGRGEELRKYPARLRARDGSIRHVEITSSGRFVDGNFINSRCFTVDVTELMAARDEARHKDELFRQVLDALPAAVYMTDASGTITYFNRASAELAGHEPQIGRDKWCVTFRLFSQDGQELAHDECPMAITLKENRPVRGVEALAQRPDGTLVPFLPFPTPICNATGALIGAVNMLVDISERKQAETNQRTLLDELNHRVKNNLQMLQGLLWSAQRESESPEAAVVLADASRRVAAMAAAQQLLYRETNPRSFGIDEFLRAVCVSARQAFESDVHVRIEAEEGDLPNDFSMPLALILNELLTNAVKYGVGERISGEITVKLQREGGDLVLRVEDDGPGFELREIGRRSSGLGLVRGILRQLRGSFSLDPGPGARCVVRFPEKHL